MASDNENDKRETIADIVADIRERAYNATRHGERTTDNYAVSELLKSIADRIEAAWKRESRAIATEHAVLPAVCITKPSGNSEENLVERERDERILFRLLWFNIEDYQSDWACNAYRQTVKDCCARLGIPYHESGREIAEEMNKSKLGVEVAKEVYGE